VLSSDDDIELPPAPGYARESFFVYKYFSNASNPFLVSPILPKVLLASFLISTELEAEPVMIQLIVPYTQSFQLFLRQMNIL
jgi:hypothetical protein